MHFSFTTVVVMAFSIYIAGILAMFRFSQIRAIYRPFIYLLWLGCVNEALSLYLALHQHYTIINITIYQLCESLMLLWFFYTLGRFKNYKALVWGLAALFIGIWVTETFLRTSLEHGSVSIPILCTRSVSCCCRSGL